MKCPHKITTLGAAFFLTTFFIQVPSAKASNMSFSISEEEKQELHKGWFEFLHSSSTGASFDENCKHIFGFDKENVTSEDEFRLSTLQRITARRVLDYQKLEKTVR